MFISFVLCSSIPFNSIGGGETFVMYIALLKKHDRYQVVDPVRWLPVCATTQPRTKLLYPLGT